MLLLVWKPFPHAYLALYLALICTPLVIRPSPHRRWFFVPLLLLTWRLLHDAEAEYITSMFWVIHLLIASDYILLTDVQRELSQQDAMHARSRSPHKIEDAALAKRIKWGLTLFFNPRGVGWAHEPHFALPARPAANTSRMHFFACQLARLAGAILLFDLGNLHVRWNPAFRLRAGLAGAGLSWRIIGTVGWVCSASSGILLAHITASLICVALGVSRPQDWPPLFGGWRDVSSVRRFWARGWHQLLRRSLCAHAKFATHVLLRLPPNSGAACCVYILAAFALSGLVHHLGETVALGGRARSGSLLFFGIQPVALALETLLAPRMPRWARALGPAWVLAWFSLTLPIMQDPLIRTGVLYSRVEVSIIMRMCRGTWVLPSVPS
ncbi:membrane bound O-acyl transferase family-domain-containing protein [Mycena belliarum]|uniref:Membrane bound O-acyl transferase family-domain-containing protein n=1 Tax=Mycena belliarum TaxID=1033014 RepID=A0AAD6UF30_9AGAR|nr:membrane bound O-acyl transferase family-domain-containing protein [Mycena belliae]